MNTKKKKFTNYDYINWNNIVGKGYKGIANSNDYIVAIKGSKNSKKSFNAIYIDAWKRVLTNVNENPLFLKKKSNRQYITMKGMKTAKEAINSMYPNTIGNEWVFSSEQSNRPFIKNLITGQSFIFGAWDGSNVDNLSGMSGGGKFTSKIYIDEPINSTDSDADIDNVTDKRAIFTAISSVANRIESKWYETLPKHLQPQVQIRVALNPWNEDYWMMTEWFVANNHDKQEKFRENLDYSVLDVPNSESVQDYITKNIKGYFYQRVMFNPKNKDDKRTMLLVTTNLACNEKLSSESFEEEYYNNIKEKQENYKNFLVKGLGYIGRKPENLVNIDNILNKDIGTDFFPLSIGFDGGKGDPNTMYLIGIDKTEQPKRTLHIPTGVYLKPNNKGSVDMIDISVEYLTKWIKDYGIVKPTKPQNRIIVWIDTRDYQFRDYLVKYINDANLIYIKERFVFKTAKFKNKKNWLIEQRLQFWALITGSKIDKRLNLNISKKENDIRNQQEITAMSYLQQELKKMSSDRITNTKYKYDHSLNAVEYGVYKWKNIFIKGIKK